MVVKNTPRPTTRDVGTVLYSRLTQHFVRGPQKTLHHLSKRQRPTAVVAASAKISINPPSVEEAFE